MLLTDFVRRALLVPFKDKGRDWDGWDCWGLIYVAQREVWGRCLPLHIGEYADAGDTADSRRYLDDVIRKNIEAACLSVWHQVPAPKQGDVAVVRMANRPIHVALCIGNQSCLHVLKGSGTHIFSSSGLVWRRRIEGYYRYNDAG